MFGQFIFSCSSFNMHTSVILLSCLSLIGSCKAARILAVFPTPSISHQVVFRPLTQELAKRGHEVTVITTDPAFPKGQTPGNLTEIDVHDISYKIWREHFLKTVTGNNNGITQQMETILRLFYVIFEKQMHTEEFQKVLKKSKDHFDLLILELCVRPTLVLSHVFKAPVIQISSLGALPDSHGLMGGPTHPLLYPNSFRQRINNLTLWEKVTELYAHYSYLRMNDKVEEAENEMLKKNFGPDVPQLSKLKENVGMMFLNMHPLIEGNIPVPPSMQYIWGIHSKPEKELPKDMKEYLDSSKHGVIYMSFGTNTDPTLLPPDKIQVFVRVFSKLPYDVLWKWNGDELPGRTDNIKIGKWFPQSDLLRHQKVKLFVTQGGIQSTDEAITAGVPLVGIPMLADQWYNVEKYEQLKIGKKLDIETITDKKFKDAVMKVIDDKGYRENILRLRALMRDQPQPPLARAVWWTEHVLRHAGASHLRAPAANMHWTRYYEIELVLTLLSVFSVALFLCLFFVLKIYIYVTKHYLGSTKVKVS